MTKDSETGPSNSRRTRVRIVLAVVGAILVGTFIVATQFSASGTGEYKASPDGKYTAHLSGMRDRSLFSGTRHYVEIKIEENATGRLVWTAEYEPPAGTVLIDYADRSRQFIQWDPSSRQVDLPLDPNGTVVSIPVP